jgi:hypothetical protein
MSQIPQIDSKQLDHIRTRKLIQSQQGQILPTIQQLLDNLYKYKPIPSIPMSLDQTHIKQNISCLFYQGYCSDGYGDFSNGILIIEQLSSIFKICHVFLHFSSNLLDISKLYSISNPDHLPKRFFYEINDQMDFSFMTNPRESDFIKDFIKKYNEFILFLQHINEESKRENKPYIEIELGIFLDQPYIKFIKDNFRTLMCLKIDDDYVNNFFLIIKSFSRYYEEIQKLNIENNIILNLILNPLNFESKIYMSQLGLEYQYIKPIYNTTDIIKIYAVEKFLLQENIYIITFFEKISVHSRDFRYIIFPSQFTIDKQEKFNSRIINIDEMHSSLQKYFIKNQDKSYSLVQQQQQQNKMLCLGLSPFSLGMNILDHKIQSHLIEECPYTVIYTNLNFLQNCSNINYIINIIILFYISMSSIDILNVYCQKQLLFVLNIIFKKNLLRLTKPPHLEITFEHSSKPYNEQILTINWICGSKTIHFKKIVSLPHDQWIQFLKNSDSNVPLIMTGDQSFLESLFLNKNLLYLHYFDETLRKFKEVEFLLYQLYLKKYKTIEPIIEVENFCLSTFFLHKGDEIFSFSNDQQLYDELSHICSRYFESLKMLCKYISKKSDKFDFKRNFKTFVYNKIKKISHQQLRI